MNKNILITGGTVFVSRYAAEYYVNKGYNVYVMNRNTRPQSPGVKLIEADRSNIGDALRSYHFDIILDITAYNSSDINCLLDAVDGFDTYVMISSSAVYPETSSMPIIENATIGENIYWGKYGTDKIDAEKALLQRVPDAYILRPPYLYGPGNNLYREAFVFDCALLERKFYLPKNGQMKLQFFHVYDLCRFIDKILEAKPKQHIFNVGNKDAVTVREWVELCYGAVNEPLATIFVTDDINQLSYFCFRDYEYYLDTSAQFELMTDTIPLSSGLKESLNWYIQNRDKVRSKPFMEFIDLNIK